MSQLKTFMFWITIAGNYACSELTLFRAHTYHEGLSVYELDDPYLHGVRAYAHAWLHVESSHGKTGCGRKVQRSAQSGN